VLRNVAGFYLRHEQPGKAVAPLRSLLALGKASPDDQAWARRGLAQALAAGGTYQQFREALQLLDANLRDGDGVADQRAKATLLATRVGHRKEALRLLEDLNRRQLLEADSLFVLAQLYDLDNNWPRAQLTLQTLLGSVQGKNPAYYAYYAGRLVRKGDVAGAQTWLAKLESTEPESFRCQEIRARVLAAQGQAGEAAALLRTYAQGKDARLDLTAALLEELGQAAAAEEIYRKLAARSEKPESILVVAQYLGRQKRLPEALDLCERAWQSCPPEAVSATAVGALYAAPANDPQCRRVAGWIEAAMRKAPQTLALPFYLAVVHERQGRYADAEALYRQVIQRDNGKEGPLNNLAWLLALRGGSGTEALSLINCALELAGPTARLLDTRAVIYLARGQGDLAVKDLEAVVAQNPTAPYYFHLAQAYLTTRNRSAAAAAWQKAKTLGFEVGMLHPLERPAYDQLLRQLPSP
jgi:tetratricopeptide (TPR) repeat protein